jgi:hypothetical protein
MFPLTDVKLFNYYHRYKWDEIAFGMLQDTLINFPATIFANMAGDAVLKGLNQNGFSGLNANYLSGFAVNSLGNLLGASANGSVAVANNVNSLVVIRPVNANTTPITRPTAPFDSVFLNTEQTAQVVAISGTLGVYPSKAAGDVILFGAIAAGGVITLIDESKCELFGKSFETKTVNVIGNHRDCHYLDIPTAIAALSAGAKMRVRDSATINAPIVCALNDVDIQFDPGVVYTNGTAGTGFTLSGTGIKFINGRLTGFTAGIAITGNYCSILNTRFASNTTDVTDALATSQQVGVISE